MHPIAFVCIAATLGGAVTAPLDSPGSVALEPVAGVRAADRTVDSHSGTAAQERTTDRRFWVKDTRFYYSDWYAGRHRKMINFGCTRAPYYAPDPRCVRNRGYHHGLDVAMRCGNRLYAGFGGRVVRPDSPGALGPAYGAHAFRVRNQRLDRDFVIGHVRRVYVDPGDRVRKGQLVARASDAAAPDGCHLHFEVRPKRAGYASAINPRTYIRLRLTR